MRVLTVLASAIAMLTLVVGSAVAQTRPPTPATPPPAPVHKPAVPETKEVEGTAKKVDAAAKSVQVSSGLLGLFGATLEVTGRHQDQRRGQGRLALRHPRRT